MTRGSLRGIWAAAAAGLLAVFAAAANQSITSVVRDSAGGVIPGVTLILTHIDTGMFRQSSTDENGNYTFQDIRPGLYELKASLEGFQPVKVTGIRVEIGDNESIPLILSVSQLTAEVEVHAGALQVETSTSQLDAVVDNRQITDLPLNGRDPLDLVYLTPGIVTDVAGPSANGSRGRGTNYMLDGLDNNNTVSYGYRAVTYADSVAEFRVITSNPSAEYGRAGGAIVEVITRSGTNRFHGNAYEFHRGDALDAKTWRENYYGQDKGEYRRDQFGGSFGGPIVKDKLFFFVNTEFIRMSHEVMSTAYVPLQSYRDTVTNPEIARIFQTYYPLPNNDSEAWVPEVAGDYSWPSPTSDYENQLTAKIDFNPSQDHVFSVRYYYDGSGNNDSEVLPGTDLGRCPSSGRTQSVAMDWTWIPSPTIVNNLKVGQNRMVYGYRRLETNAVDLLFQGWATDMNIYFTDFGGPYGSGNSWNNAGTFEVKDTLTWNKGTHTIKFGLDIRAMQDNGETGIDVYPFIGFDQYYGFAGPDTAANIATGTADYCYQGIYSNGREFIPDQTDHRGWREKEYDFFIQDDWKIRPNFTLNAGLRYEWKPSPSEANDYLSNIPPDGLANGYHLPNMNNFFDPANFIDGDWTSYIESLYYGGTGNGNWQGTGTDIYIDSDGQDVYQAPKTNWAPRLGFSWDPFGDGKTAVRGGYGISYDRMFDQLLTWNTSQIPFAIFGFYPAVEPGYSGIWPDVAYFGHGSPVPSFSLHPPPNSNYESVYYNYDWKQPYIQTWSVSIQRELWPGDILHVAYAGSAGVHMLVRANPNQMFHPTAEFIADLEAIGYSTSSVPWFVRYAMAQNTQFSRIHLIDTSAHSTYHSLQLSYSHRYRAGLQFTANYTWAKALDDNSEVVYGSGGYSAFYADWYNKRYDRGYAAFDVRHVCNATVIYQLPIGPNHRWLGTSKGVLAALAGGWQVNTIFQANSGAPLDYKVPRDTLGTGYTNSRGPARPDVACYTVTTYQNQVGPTAANFVNYRTSINLAHPQGNYYRGYFRAPGFWNIDFSLFKEFRLPWFSAEGAKLQFRAEAFNLLNHTNWGTPSTTLGSAQLGKTYYARFNREIQLGIKFIF